MSCNHFLEKEGRNCFNPPMHGEKYCKIHIYGKLKQEISQLQNNNESLEEEARKKKRTIIFHRWITGIAASIAISLFLYNVSTAVIYKQKIRVANHLERELLFSQELEEQSSGLKNLRPPKDAQKLAERIDGTTDYYRALKYTALGEFDEASIYWNKALEDSESELNKVFLGLARNEFYLGNYQIALDWSQSAYNIRSRESLDTKFELGITSYHAGEYQNAKKIFEEFVINDNKNFRAIYHLGINELALGNYKKCDSLLNEALKLVDSPGSNYREQAFVYNALAVSKRKQGKFNNAISHYEKSISKYEEKNDLQNLGFSYNNVGAVYLQKREYEIADSLFALSYGILSNIFDSSHFAVTFPLDNKSLSAIYQKKYEIADSLIEKVLEIKENATHSEHPLMITTLNNVAELNKGRKKLKEAIQTWQKIIATQKKVQGKSHPDLIVSYTALGSYLIELGAADKGKPFLDSAYQIALVKLDSNHLYFGTIYDNYGDFYNQKGQYNEALKQHLSALAIKERIFAPDHSQVALILNDIGSDFIQLKRYKEAEQALTQCYPTFKSSFGEKSKLFAILMFNFGELYLGTEKYSLAVDALSCAYIADVDIYKQPNHPFLMEDREKLSLALSLIRKQNEAIYIKEINNALQESKKTNLSLIPGFLSCNFEPISSD